MFPSPPALGRLPLFLAALVVALLALLGVAFQGQWVRMNVPGASSPVVPAMVLEVARCLEREGVRDFRVAGSLREDAEAYQRLVEVAWPVEVSDGSPVLVVRSQELHALCRGARTLCRVREVTVAACVR